MPFQYRLQKILEFRIRKKEEQLQEVRKAQALVIKIEGLIERNNKEISSTRENMRKADFIMYEAYDTFLKHLYVIGESLEIDLRQAQDALEIEKEKLRKLEQAVKILENHKERAKEAYLEEEKALELKQLSEIAVQRHFAKTRDLKEEEILEQLKQLEGQDYNEYPDNTRT
jgi:flagellar export protein FliJ